MQSYNLLNGFYLNKHIKKLTDKNKNKNSSVKSRVEICFNKLKPIIKLFIEYFVILSFMNNFAKKLGLWKLTLKRFLLQE